MMTFLFGMVAFAIDIGFIVHARTELQRTADACALGAAQKLSSQDAAVAYAQHIAQENRASVGPDLDSSDVLFGYWNRDAATFTSPAPAGRYVNAVRVILRRTEAAGTPLRLFFAPILGTGLADITAQATAWADHGVCGPFVGIDWLDVRGNATTDSYNSSAGPYSPSTAGDRGSICSDGPIDVMGHPLVRGDATAGKGEEVRVRGAAEVTGRIGNRLTPLNLPPVDTSDAAVNNDNKSAPSIQQGHGAHSRDAIDASGDFQLNVGEAYNLPPGTYYVRNFSMSSQSVLNISGPTTIYVTGKLLRAGTSEVNNNTQLAANLQFLSTGGKVEVTSNTPFYGVIYAPQSDVTVRGNDDLFGAIVGKTLKIIGNSMAHYDETLDLDDLGVPPRIMLVD